MRSHWVPFGSIGPECRALLIAVDVVVSNAFKPPAVSRAWEPTTTSPAFRVHAMHVWCSTDSPGHLSYLDVDRPCTALRKTHNPIQWVGKKPLVKKERYTVLVSCAAQKIPLSNDSVTQVARFWIGAIRWQHAIPRILVRVSRTRYVCRRAVYI